MKMAPSEDQCQKHFVGVKAAGAWGRQPHHLHVPNFMEIWEPKPPGTLWATPGLLWDCFTFTFYWIKRSFNRRWKMGKRTGNFWKLGSRKLFYRQPVKEYEVSELEYIIVDTKTKIMKFSQLFFFKWHCKFLNTREVYKIRHSPNTCDGPLLNLKVTN